MANECNDIMARLSADLEGELSAEAIDEMERHIEGCGPCVEYMESVKKSIALCKANLPVEQPRPLDEDARKELRAAYQRMVAARKS
ncbi:MAG TPA: hypothetical protein DEH78_09275 [Solibacterales bacterium]|nr:hypothetical protein [Bryobacterales bacterium]